MKKTIIALALVAQSFFAVSAMAGENDFSNTLSESDAQAIEQNQINTNWGIGIVIAPSYPRPMHRGAVCEARNRRGQFFRSRGYNVRDAERNVLDKCYSYSRHCVVTSCYRNY